MTCERAAADGTVAMLMLRCARQATLSDVRTFVIQQLELDPLRMTDCANVSNGTIRGYMDGSEPAMPVREKQVWLYELEAPYGQPWAPAAEGEAAGMEEESKRDAAAEAEAGAAEDKVPEASAGKGRAEERSAGAASAAAAEEEEEKGSDHDELLGAFPPPPLPPPPLPLSLYAAHAQHVHRHTYACTHVHVAAPAMPTARRLAKMQCVHFRSPPSAAH